MYTFEEFRAVWLFVIVVCVIIAVVYTGISIRLTRKAKEIIETDKNYLREMSLNATKHILVMDFYFKWFDYIAPNRYKQNGIWLDYEGERIAIRDSGNKNDLPKIFSFQDVSDCELLEGATTIYSATTGGYGPFSYTSGHIKEFADDTFVRVVFGGKRGTQSMTIQLYHGHRRTGGFYKDSRGYQAILKCAQSMVDELNNIMHL